MRSYFIQLSTYDVVFSKKTADTSEVTDACATER